MIREINVSIITDHIAEMCIKANHFLSDDMKTALEKRMIWTTTDPQMIVSCDVYMVMKWIAEWWNITKSPEIKENYWNVAESKGMLNWCTKWAKLTYANL